MEKCFILASSQDRTKLLRRCIEDMSKNELYKNADIYLYWQGTEEAIPYKERFNDIIISPTLRGIFKPRYELFKRCKDYDYVILIDDDIFMYPDTTYEGAISFLKMMDNKGICNLGSHFDKRRNQLQMIDYSKDDYNVCGGIVFPKECIEVLIDYFKDTPENVTEDIFWILLYIKGYDLYRDFSSNVIHTCHRPADNGEPSGYYKLRIEKPYIPLLPEYTNHKLIPDYCRKGQFRYKIPETRDVNVKGLEERMKNKEAFKNGKNGKTIDQH